MTMGQTVREGPVYLALESGIRQFLGPIVGYDVRTLTDFQNAPIDAVRAYVEARGVIPHTLLFGEQYERDVTAAWGRWYNERDSQSILDLLATLLKARILPTYLHNRHYLELCITPSPYRIGTDAAYRQYVTNVVEWLVPFYAEVGHLTIKFCVSWSRQWVVNAAWGKARHRMVSTFEG